MYVKTNDGGVMCHCLLSLFWSSLMRVLDGLVGWLGSHADIHTRYFSLTFLLLVLSISLDVRRYLRSSGCSLCSSFIWLRMTIEHIQLPSGRL